MKKQFILVVLCFVLISLAACMPVGEPTHQATPDQTTQSLEIEVSVHEPTATTLAEEPYPSSPSVPPNIFPSGLLTGEEGPLLLIQTGFFDFEFINPLTQAVYPVDLPQSDSQFRLQPNLSPSGRQMFFPLDNETGIIADLRTGEVISVYDMSSPELFAVELAVVEAEPYVTELQLNEVGLLEAVTQAHQSSRKLLSWHQSDRYHLSVHDTGRTSTGLFLDDHQTGTRLQLEAQPGLVEAFQVGPDGNTILVKKGFALLPGAYGDKRYFLVNLADPSTQEITLPEDAINPTVAWFSADTLAVTQHTDMSGGSGFSLIDIQTMDTFQVIKGEFSDIRPFGEHLFFLYRIKDPSTTTIQLITITGDVLATQIIDQHCFFQFAVSNHVFIQCSLESFIIDRSLNIEPFSDAVLNIIPAPDGNASVMVNRSEQAYLLDADTQLQYELPLEEPPLEIRWLPDSNGFIYRTHGRLFYFDPYDLSGHILIASDLLTDYTNINAVWVNLD